MLTKSLTNHFGHSCDCPEALLVDLVDRFTLGEVDSVQARAYYGVAYLGHHPADCRLGHAMSVSSGVIECIRSEEP